MIDSQFIQLLYPEIVNNMQLGLHIYHLGNLEDDRTLRIISANPAAGQFTGLASEEVVGKTIDRCFPALRSQGIPQLYAEVVRSGQAIELEKEIFFDASYISESWFSFKLFPLPRHCVGVLFEDITLRKQAEESLRQNKVRYRAIVEDQTELICRYLPDGRLTFVNGALCRYFGQKQPVLIGQNIMAIINLPQTEDVSEAFIIAPPPETPVRTIKLEVVLSTGERRWQQWSIRAIFDSHGHLIEFQSVGKDITSLKKTEEALKKSEQRARELLAAEREQRLLAETLREVTLALTSQTDHEAILDEILYQVERIVPYCIANITLLKENALYMSRMQGPKASNLDKAILNHPQRLEEFRIEAEIIETRTPVVISDTRNETRWIVLEETAWIRSHLVLPICHQKHVLGLLRLDSDTPNQYTAEDVERLLPLANAAAIALENARLYEQARQDAETKSILLNEVNHRVKNNLAAIIGLLYAKQEYASRPANKADYQTTMKDLISQMQGLATAHSMLSASQWTPLLLSELARQVIHSTLRALAYNNHSVSVKVLPSPVRITSDQAHHIALVINELTTNTLKHALAMRQTIQITVRIKRNDRTVQLEFRDDGPGYSEEFFKLDLAHHSMGFELIDNIVYKNLGGKVTPYNDNGAVTMIEFNSHLVG